MGSSTHDPLTPLRRAFLTGFFAREQRFSLIGGAALAGLYFGHRETEDLDLLAAPGAHLDDGERALRETAAALEPGAATSDSTAVGAPVPTLRKAVYARALSRSGYAGAIRRVVSPGPVRPSARRRPPGAPPPSATRRRS